MSRKRFLNSDVYGTEYSEYIESSRNLNVLTETWQRARQILLQNLKPIPQ